MNFFWIIQGVSGPNFRKNEKMSFLIFDYFLGKTGQNFQNYTFLRPEMKLQV